MSNTSGQKSSKKLSTYYKKSLFKHHQTLGAVLSQKKPDEQEHPVAYASQSLSLAEKNYGTPALKHLAIYYAVIK
ncbi:hypothetical protein G9A89_014362 [Geosiphon pyriformis]|nr:hypothetical protein G9A89_014362 [Geosiphon pyriformis]